MGRTSKNIKFRIPEKPRKIKGFRNGGFPIATTISSQPRYDHFDISPYEIVFEFCDVSVMCHAETLRAKLKKTRAFER